MQKNKIAIALVLAALSASVIPQASYASPERTRFYYNLGGGRPIAGSGNQGTTIRVFDSGVSWNSNLSCGAGFDPSLTFANQMNGITDGFYRMMEDMQRYATEAVAGLPGAILKRANPHLYEVMENGAIQSKVDFTNGLNSCERMQDVMIDVGSSGGSLTAMSENFAWKTESERPSTDPFYGDVISAQQKVNETGRNHGVPWYDGTKRGGLKSDGTEQLPIESIEDTTRVGYNHLMNRSLTDDSEVSEQDGEGKPLWMYWKSPEEAAKWVTSVVGEVSWMTCDTCIRARGTPGLGLTYFYDEAINELEHNLQQIVDGNIPITRENLDRVSAPPSLMVRQEVIEAIRFEESYDQPLLISRIAGEIALTRTFEKGVLAKRLLATGKKEPNISNVPDAQASIDNAYNQLTDELNTLVDEMELRKRVTGSTLQIVSDRYIHRRNQAAQQSNPLPASNIQQYFGRE